jgi:hypothetical protein
MQVARHSNEPPRKEILNSILRQLDSLSECLGVLETTVGRGTATTKVCPLPHTYFPLLMFSQPHKRKAFNLEELPDDILFIVVDQFDSSTAPFDLYPVRDVKTLCSLRWYVNLDICMHC